MCLPMGTERVQEQEGMGTKWITNPITDGKGTEI